ncbi:MAG: DNA repair exonuclease [Parcubacteria group bacterium]|nr:DNA repair exonuclease [Parcubacteria group bacterium]
MSFPVTFVHTSDIHLGKAFTQLGVKGAEQRAQLRATFEKVVDQTIEWHAAFLVIAGDLFDIPDPAPVEVATAKRAFARLNEVGCAVVLVPGTHDYFGQGTVYTDRSLFGGNVYIFHEETSFVFSDHDITFYGKANTSERSNESPLAGLARKQGTRFHVALAHGSARDKDHGDRMSSSLYYPFDTREIEKLAMDYVALGHWHGLMEITPTVWYSGSPEPLTLTQTRSGYINKVLLEEGKPTVVHRERVGRRSFDRVTIDLTGVADVDFVRPRILEGASQDLIREVLVKGASKVGLSFDAEALEKELESSFFRLTIRDTSHFVADELTDAQYPEELAIGQFVKIMKERVAKAAEDEKHLEEQALKIGIALLQGKKLF